MNTIHKRIVGFTGPRSMRDGQIGELLLPLFESMKDVDEFVTGAAYGLDTAAAYNAFAYWPEKKHTIIVPAALHNREVVQYGFDNGFDLIMAPGKANVRDAYMVRNDMLVARITELHAFPTTPERLRSGTWSTIRRARRQKVPITYHKMYL